MTTNYNANPSKAWNNGFGQLFTDTIFSATLKAATEATLTVPTTAAMGVPAANTNNKFVAIISCDASSDTFLALNGTAAVPVGNTFAATTSLLVPPECYFAKICKAGDVLHFISPGTPSVTVEFYAIVEN